MDGKLMILPTQNAVPLAAGTISASAVYGVIEKEPLWIRKTGLNFDI
jgi:hypothetical protein